MIEKIRIKNLRSIQDSGLIDIKPINILLGPNSSGKSTFLRSFPLITQSVNKSLRGPISWFDSSLVDFGDYKTAKNKFSSQEDCISFSYVFGGTPVYRRFYFSHEEVYRIASASTGISLDSITFGLDGDTNGTFIKMIEIKSTEFSCSLTIASRDSAVKIMINGKNVDIPEEVKFLRSSNLGILPIPYVINQANGEPQRFGRWAQGILEKRLAKLCDARLKNYERLNPIIHYGGTDKVGFLNQLKKNSIISLKKRINQWNVSTVSFIELYDLLMLSKVDSFIATCNDEIWNFYNNCGYIAPLRAEANRYYRNQELQVNDVDSYGRNLQEFISSLSKTDKKDYDAFINEVLTVSTHVSSSLGHQSISLRSKNGDFNLADVGSGYAQILPILTKIWHSLYLMKNPRRRKYYGPEKLSTVLLIEQPELHLHPALQAKIADVLIKAIDEARKNDCVIRLIVETHSPTIINRLGLRIREGVAKPEDINVILFEKSPDAPNTHVKSINYNNKGQLVDWPWGFLDPTD